jgi:hypothetical protein
MAWAGGVSMLGGSSQLRLRLGLGLFSACVGFYFRWRVTRLGVSIAWRGMILADVSGCGGCLQVFKVRDPQDALPECLVEIETVFRNFEGFGAVIVWNEFQIVDVDATVRAVLVLHVFAPAADFV